MTLPVTPSQTVGPFVHLGFDPMTRADAAAGAAGPVVTLSGRVLDGQGQPIPDAVLEVWQANAAGRYDHPDDRRNVPLDPAFRGFLRVPTDAGGRYRLRTIRPGPVPGPGGRMQAPHLLVCLFMRGLLRHLYTRVYFAGDPANDGCPILALVPAGRRSTMVALPDGEGAYRWDIVMQGPSETVFLNL
ncbi:protocatechuate 3,4-dioxygenase alpha subunit [Stella humosa]|uniref:Protocatechuate 3,4-dioxygenase alpha subunit n=1 Tax=Stella humosa TaxID=94 RepID=A0A3N1L4Z4_9PROT|nr:protocatechuate 3,4-dioxygenase subunit alpha [Stella humosa]ROP84455.1 protocatechuate 3,4-dioxygenase alpha subunit [Stella humosa]BBK33973.1 protocatechuate 3,4-dioxygenase subunit alpha [Stella humosa]